MLAGEVTPNDSDALKRALRNAEKDSGLKFSLYVGDSEGDPRRFAEDLHKSLESPDDSVLVMCDPQGRALEVVTGSHARRGLDDGECAMAVATMESSFTAGDLVGGLSHGIQQLGAAARTPRTEHFRDSLS